MSERANDAPPAVMKLADVAEFQRRGINQVRADVRAGRIPAVRYGRCIRVLRDELIEAMRRDTQAAQR